MGKPIQGAGRVAVLARLPKIVELIAAGWSVSAVYQKLGSELGISEVQFRRYIARYIVVEEPTPIVVKVGNPLPAPDAPSVNSGQGSARPAPPPKPAPVPVKRIVRIVDPNLEDFK